MIELELHERSFALESLEATSLDSLQRPWYDGSPSPVCLIAPREEFSWPQWNLGTQLAKHRQQRRRSEQEGSYSFISRGGLTMQPFEKLGAFYLGQEYDLAKAERLDRLIMYNARDLTTQAVCVGMTGSGKTGLCVDLLEEAAIDSVPAIMIDPKGDLTNLLLTFPELRPADFEPWINVDNARRKGMSVGEYAQYITDTWR